MSANFVSVGTLDRLEDLFTRSHSEPVILFKHSSTCGISAGVYHEVEQVDAEVNLIVVQTEREVSDAIAQRTGIRHESPQAILLRNGEVVYTASHFRITAAEIMSLLS